jgi:hypothetical protein
MDGPGLVFWNQIRNGEWSLRDGMYYNPEANRSGCVSARRTMRRSFPFRITERTGGSPPPRCLASDGFDELKRLNVSSYAEGGMGMTIRRQAT